MDGRRTYLDSLNAGRQRKPQSALDELNRSLERLGERLDRRNERPAGGRDEQPRPRFTEEAHWHQAELSARIPTSGASPPRDDAYLASTGRLAAEVNGLRDELRMQMSSGLQREFDSLRKDISRAYAQAPSPRSNELAAELDRLSQSIEALSNRSDDKGLNLLRLDIEQIRSEMESLAREESVLSLDSRWDQLDRRWNEQRLDARKGTDDGFAALNARLQQITDAVHGLPETLPLKSLEDKVRTLAGAVDQFSRLPSDRAPQFLETIELRLDEISRAIVASTAAAQTVPFDFAPIERIDNRIAALAGQLEHMSGAGASAQIIERLNALSERIDDVARQADVPAQSVERLASQIAIIADKIDTGSHLPDAHAMMHGLESRFDQFAQAVERRQDVAIETSQAMFREMELRLHDVVSKLDDRPRQSATDAPDLMEAIDARLDDFSRRLESRKADIFDRSFVTDLEAKIDTISNRIDKTPPSGTGFDPDLIRNLETQVAGLSAFLARPEQPAVDTISPRLEQMEQALHGNRDLVIDAARRAAEDVVRSFRTANPGSTDVVGLQNDLKSLETLTRRSDDRNAKTFEAIHDTLLKIVDRLGTIENGHSPAPTPKLPIARAPSIEPLETMSQVVADEHDTAPHDDYDVAPNDTPSPAAAAAFAAMAAVDDVSPALPVERRRGMLGGLGRAFAMKKPTRVPTSAAIAAERMQREAEVDLDEPLDPKAANRPLQPGSGAPDLSSIMKRVRDERALPAKAVEADAAKSDFIAAARRAAQAAAAEAEVLKRHSDIAGPGRGLKLGDLLKSRRKTLLVSAAAVLIAFAGLQLGKAMLSERSMVANASVGAEQPDVPIATENTAPQNASVAPIAASALGESKPADASGDVTPLAEVAGNAAVPAAPVEPEVTAAVDPAADAMARVDAAALPKTEPDAGPVALRDAADSGDPRAMFEVGARYSEGRGTKTDNAKAAQWYERAAAAGLAPAQYRIGNMYEKGVGVERNLATAKTWYQMAAEQGNASAMHNLAVLYAMGADGTTDNDSAGRWFIKAGELGVKDSQFNLGILNAKGVGMPQSLEESYKWFALVAKTGDRDAATKRDEIANSLRPEQLERARAATELWKARAVDPASNVVDIPDEWQESGEKTAGVDMKKGVQTIQVILNKNGYDAGGADGVMGEKTKEAIVAFQKDNDLPADGAVTEKLVQELLARK